MQLRYNQEFGPVGNSGHTDNALMQLLKHCDNIDGPSMLSLHRNLRYWSTTSCFLWESMHHFNHTTLKSLSENPIKVGSSPIVTTTWCQHGNPHWLKWQQEQISCLNSGIRLTCHVNLQTGCNVFFLLIVSRFSLCQTNHWCCLMHQHQPAPMIPHKFCTGSCEGSLVLVGVGASNIAWRLSIPLILHKILCKICEFRQEAFVCVIVFVPNRNSFNVRIKFPELLVNGYV